MPTSPPDRARDATTEPGSLRERKKAKTRAALVEVSQRLFDEQGYAATTLNQICAEVEITAPTLLRYFDSKARLALAPMTEPLEDLERLLDDPERTVDTLTTWRKFTTVESREASNPTSAATVSYMHNLRAYRQWVDKDPTLVAMASDVERRLRELLARALAADRADNPADLHTALLAALLVAGRVAVWDHWLASESDTGSLVDDQLTMVDYAVACLASDAVPHFSTEPVLPADS